METFVEMLPKKVQAVINAFIFLLDAAILVFYLGSSLPMG